MSPNVPATDDYLGAESCGITMRVMPELRAHPARDVDRNVAQLTAEFLCIELPVKTKEPLRHSRIVVVRPGSMVAHRRRGRMIQTILQQRSPGGEPNSPRRWPNKGHDRRMNLSRRSEISTVHTHDIVSEAHHNASIRRQPAFVTRIQPELDQPRFQLSCIPRPGLQLERELEALPGQVEETSERSKHLWGPGTNVFLPSDQT